MTASRDRILGRIKTGVNAEARSNDKRDELSARISSPQRNLVPEFTKKEGRERLELFTAKAEAQGTTIKCVKSPQEALDEVRDFLRQNNLPARVVRSPSSELNDLGLESAADLEVRQGSATESDITSVTPAFGAVAETGTVVTSSGKETPSTLNFVPENHIAIIRERDLMSSYEDSWDKLREGNVPRTVNWISGPSRSGDIGMVMYMGAHGPKRQHVIVIEED
jgi:L-lactate dehydrogenase complex protein LldG